ncbi:MAG: argininosuccinate synthase [Chloroflexi bacterium]|nr:argininosuccinate synthase [Chloroflexota bacterium]MCI0779831.1 argininosuccinate synthase [Chloroflexota bacterium]MCI0785669.1 argininosuccinate synthase [Chloroflexota bacterium]MCI0792079.1 argininosuccinate synthase [Chloroflexota bacterium]MCI0797910.1 argininosuccinate synthase [Chloroflexota bacterium]
MPENKIVLAFSGGLDTSVAVSWLKEKYGAEIVTLTIDLGMVDLEAIRQRALRVGAAKALTVDAKEALVKDFLFPALRAGAVYEEQYPLATALGRPLIARCLAEAAQAEGAFAVAHGCTGKGNDQVRLEVSMAALAPDIKVIAPIRDWGMSRQDEIDYAKERDLPISASDSRFSVDENLWGRSVEAGELEDPWLEPPEEAYVWTKPLAATPDEPTYLVVHFQQGAPTAIDGEEMAGVDLIVHLNGLAGGHGIGRVDHVENRLVGIKSREIYETPAAIVLHAAHKALEALTLSKEQARTKARVAQEYADMVYNGLWFTAHRQDLDAYVRSTQRYVTGDVRVRLHKATCTVVGRTATNSLYQYDLATYGREDTFDQAAAEGFISIYGLPVRTQSQAQPE